MQDSKMGANLASQVPSILNSSNDQDELQHEGDNMIPYTLIRSSRRTLSIQISRDGELIARAPMRLSIPRIESFIMSKESWIEKHKQKIQGKIQKTGRKTYSETEIQEMKERL
jgi:predicted metal-dependent hydrolase